MRNLHSFQYFLYPHYGQLLNLEQSEWQLYFEILAPAESLALLCTWQFADSKLFLGGELGGGRSLRTDGPDGSCLGAEKQPHVPAMPTCSGNIQGLSIQVLVVLCASQTLPAYCLEQGQPTHDDSSAL